jgi:hypothetical protein
VAEQRNRQSPLADRTRRTVLLAITGLALLLPVAALAQPTDKGNPYAGMDVSDDKLVSELSGFKRGFADVNGIRLH